MENPRPKQVELSSPIHVCISTLHLPDADDRHVLAAAIAAKATVIVTYDLSDYFLLTARRAA